MDSESTTYTAISIRLRDFAPARLVCLAAALKEQYRGRKKITVLVFSSRDAAKYYHGDVQIGDFGPPENAKQAMRQDAGWSAKQLHAIYSYDAAKREEYIAIQPLGYLGGLPEDTRINLPMVAVPRRRLEISKRCLLALDDVVYARGAYQAKLAGTVTLTGTVTRQGTVTRIQVADAKSVPAGTAEPLVREAVDNLKTWRLEPALRQDVFRITYSYIIDPSLPQRGQVDVKFALPNQITIRANPPD